MVYPRVCGGTSCTLGRRSLWHGLSPRVRGNLKLGYPLCRRAGSIPACAGEPSYEALRCVGFGVYPRVCGGTMCIPTARKTWYGLSPRVRGNRDGHLAAGQGEGSIPACAGEPRGATRNPAAVWVYPRVCGGTSATGRILAMSQGLSPRVRGNRGRHAGHTATGGSIPACAGEPLGELIVSIAHYSPKGEEPGTASAVFYQVHAISIHNLLWRLS